MIVTSLRTAALIGAGAIALATGAGCSGSTAASPSQPAADALKKEAERQKQIHYREAHNKP